MLRRVLCAISPRKRAQANSAESRFGLREHNVRLAVGEETVRAASPGLAEGKIETGILVRFSLALPGKNWTKI